MKRGIFITFEGAEGAGKSTQIRRTAAFFRRRGRKVLMLREPGGTRISEAIRRLLLNPAHGEMADETELLLYLAARAQLVREKILPELKQGNIVICDRFEDSSTAYQGFGRGIGRKVIEGVSRDLVRGGLKPDLTFLLDIPSEKGLARGGRRDRIEQASMDFHRRVRRGFLEIARREKKRFVVLDARGSRDEVFAKIRERLANVLG